MALNARHPNLLRGSPPYRDPAQTAACDALDAARARLRGDDAKATADQMALDLRGQ